MGKVNEHIDELSRAIRHGKPYAVLIAQDDGTVRVLGPGEGMLCEHFMRWLVIRTADGLMKGGYKLVPDENA